MIDVKTDLRSINSLKLKELLKNIPDEYSIVVNTIGNLVAINTQKESYCYIDLGSETINFFDKTDFSSTIDGLA